MIRNGRCSFGGWKHFQKQFKGRIMTINNTYAYALKVRHEKKRIEDERNAKNQYLQTEKLNQQTTSTGLFGANRNDNLNKRVGGAYQKIKNRLELENIMIQRFTNTVKAYSNDELLNFAKDTVNKV